MGAFTGEVRELIENLVGLASRAGWHGTARVTKDGDEYVIAIRVRQRERDREEELSERELRRRARAVRS